MRLGKRNLSIGLLVVLFGSLATILSACGGSTPPSGPTNLAADQTLNVGWATGGGADITTLDPGQDTDSSSVPIVAQLFDGLVTLDQNLKIEDWGASKIDISTDGKTYTFHLRDGQFFSDGTPVKASDYAYGIDRSANPCFTSPVAYYLTGTASELVKDSLTFNSEQCDSKGNITAASGQTTPVLKTLIGDSVIADDSAGTLQIILDQPAGYFLDAMTYSTSFAVEQGVVKAEGDPNLGLDGKWLDSMTHGSTGQGGSGMYYLAQWDHKSIVQLKANPNWWGVKAGKKPYLKTINYKLYSSGDTLYADYQTSSAIDFANVPAAQVATAKSQADFHSHAELWINFVEFNWKLAPFDNVDVRKAFCLAINRDAFNTAVNKGLQKPSWNLVPPGMPGYNPNVKGIDGAGTGDNTTLAQQHWTTYKATLNGAAVPPIVFSYNQSSAAATLGAQALQGMWNTALSGANTTLNTNDWKLSLHLEQTGKLQMFRFGWIADYPDPQDWLTLLWSTGSGYNWANDSVPAADTLMHQADALYAPADQAQRISLYNQAEQLLIDNAAICPMSTVTEYWRTRTYVHGYDYTSQGQPSLDDWATTYITTH